MRMLLLLLLAATLAHAQQPVSFTDAEVKRILSLGPWPPPRVTDPSNRVSGNAAAIALGERLFSDPALSRSGTIACSTCHQLTARSRMGFRARRAWRAPTATRRAS